jgi:hypothetical protein
MLESSADDPGLINALFETLGDRRRRYVLHYLWIHDTPLALRDLAEEVTIRECGAPITEISSKDVERVRISLHHAHVPKLGDADVVVHDRDTDIVALTETGERLERYSELLDRKRPSTTIS